MRYTEKDGKLILESVSDDKWNKAISKLSQLEDIEEELGLPLVAYHKLMDCLYCGDKSKIFCKTEDGIIEVGILEIDYCKKKVIFYKDKNYNDDFVYGLYSYGETWSFSKEELK